MGDKRRWGEEWARFRGKQRSCCCKSGECEYYGLILVIVGVVTIGAFLIPSKIRLIIISALMIYAGYRLFTA